jgi:hypothetical protein
MRNKCPVCRGVMFSRGEDVDPDLSDSFGSSESSCISNAESTDGLESDDGLLGSDGPFEEGDSGEETNSSDNLDDAGGMESTESMEPTDNWEVFQLACQKFRRVQALQQGLAIAYERPTMGYSRAHNLTANRLPMRRCVLWRDRAK